MTRYLYKVKAMYVIKFKYIILFSLLLISSFSYAVDIESSWENNCNRIDTVDLWNWYSLKHYTIYEARAWAIRNVWRTELYHNWIFKEYQDNVFLANWRVIWWYTGSSCSTYSRISDVEFLTGAAIKVTYDYFNPKSYSDTTSSTYNSRPTYFTFDNKKEVTDLSVSVYPFWWWIHYYVKLNAKDSSISTTGNIASQWFFENILDLWWATSGTQLSSSKSYGVRGCNVDEVLHTVDDYEIYYTCRVYHNKSGSAINGPAKTTEWIKQWTFILSKQDYDLCGYDEQFCDNKPTISNLKQLVKSPQLSKEEFGSGTQVGYKIWKFQSGSWIILNATVSGATNTPVRLAVEVYEVWNLTTSKYIWYSTGYIEAWNTWSLDVVISFEDLWTWDYYWKAKAVDTKWNESDLVDFDDNTSWNSDFSYFEGFEPYPYGYDFYNRSVAGWTLDWWVWFWALDYFPYYWTTFIPWNKWDIFNEAFDTSIWSWFEIWSVKAILAFTALWLDSNNSFKWWSCYWMATSSMFQYAWKDFDSDFSEIVWTWNIWNNVDSPSTTFTWAWDIYNPTLKAILRSQLFQYSSHARRLLIDWKDTPENIANKILEFPDKHYILAFTWKNKNWQIIGHTVVPYKVEWNRIYFWDNNISFPSVLNRYGDVIYSYNQYLEILDNWDVKFTNYNWKSYDKISLIDIEDLYNNWEKSIPFWLSASDYLYIFHWDLDIEITDPLWNTISYNSWELIENIDWAELVVPFNASLDDEVYDDSTKMIYFSKIVENLSVKVKSRSKWDYDLTVIWWDYYAKLSWVETNTWEIDNYKFDRENLEIDFDDSRSWDYDIFYVDFNNTWSWIINLSGIDSVWANQLYSFDWDKIYVDSDDWIKYELDSDNDWSYDIESYYKLNQNFWNKFWSISWYISWNTNAKMAWRKVFIDKNHDWELQENKEKFVVTDNSGYYEFIDLKKWSYNILEVPHKNWDITYPSSKKYNIILNNCYNCSN